MNTKLKLTNPTDDELSAAVAEHVAGWTDIRYEEGEDVDIEAREIYPWKGLRGTFEGKRDHIRHYATSADWVLPLLEGRGYWRSIFHDEPNSYAVNLHVNFTGCASTFPRAACAKTRQTWRLTMRTLLDECADESDELPAWLADIE